MVGSVILQRSGTRLYKMLAKHEYYALANEQASKQHSFHSSRLQVSVFNSNLTSLKDFS